MKILLRSLFVGDPNDVADNIFKNILTFQEANLGFDVPEDALVWTFISEFALTHHHPPNLATIRSHFEHVRNTEVLDRIELLSPHNPIYHGDFIKRLEEKSEDRRSRLMLEILSEAGRITQVGLEIRDGKEKIHLKGPADAMRYVTDKAHTIIAPTLGSKLGGNVLGDTEGFVKDYTRVKTDPESSLGQFSGFKQWDDAFRGARRKQMWTHAAFTGQLKSTIALNWLYNQAVFMGHSSCYFSLEMPFEQMRNILFAMHSVHGKFRQVRQKLGIQRTDVDVGLDYGRLRDGLLTVEEDNFLLEWVVADLHECSKSGEYGKLHMESYSPDSGDMKVSDISSKSQVLWDRDPFNMLVVDHALLVAPKKWVASQTERANEVMRDLKKMAMVFNRGMGISLLVLFQISREGFKAAEKNGGKYNLTHLSYANEIERSSDIVTASWFDETLRKNNRALIQTLKTRDDGHCDDFYIRTEMPCRRLFTSQDVPIIEAQRKRYGDKIDQAEILDRLLGG